MFGFQQNFTEGCGGERGGDEERIKNNAFEKIENPEILWNAKFRFNYEDKTLETLGPIISQQQM